MTLEIGPLKLPDLEDRWQSLTAIEKSLVAFVIGLVRPRVVVELGVHEAVTSRFLCKVLGENGIQGKVYGFDVPDVIEAARRQEPEVAALEASGALVLRPGQLPESLRTWLAELDGNVDVVLVDALHEYRSVLGELRLLWPRLSPGGYVVLDDYLERTDAVRWAVDTFVRQTPGAMCVPLLSDPAAEEKGIKSKIAVLRRRPYAYSRGRNLERYEWPRTKVRLLEVPVVERVWSLVRPFLRLDGGSKS
jgi:predicted O-methyltransferase YrrM